MVRYWSVHMLGNNFQFGTEFPDHAVSFQLIVVSYAVYHASRLEVL